MQKTELKNNISAMFNPVGIAVIGASATPGRIGYAITKNIIEGGYKGEVFPVNPKGGVMEFGGRKLTVYKNAVDIPSQCDMGIIVVNADIAASAVEDCGKKGMKVLIVITSGFAEVGNIEGERQLVEIARKYGMRILGPNIFGIYSASASLNATFGPAEVLPGKVALVTQSGALGIALMGKAITDRIGLSSLLSIGNKADIDDVDCLEYYENDPNTNVILIYMEGSKKGREFLRVAQRVSQKKPIIVIKAGRSARGAKAAASHTGSLSGSDKIFDAVFMQGGILRAMDADDAFRMAAALSTQPLPKGENCVIITNGGGIGVMATDACEKYDVKLLDNPELTEKLFRKFMPSFGSTKNPIDITGQGGEKGYRDALAVGLAEEAIDSLLILYCETTTTSPELLADYIVEEYKKAKGIKPVAACYIGGQRSMRGLTKLLDAGIPAYGSPDDAASALAAVIKWKKIREQLGKLKFDIKADSKAVEEANKIISNVRKEGRVQLLEHEASDILKAFGIKMLKSKLAKDLSECKKAAKEIGYPVVLKVVSEHIIHKSDVGGVKVNIKNDAELEKAFNEIMKNAKEKVPNANIRGMLVVEMLAEKGVETIVGSTQDPAFGPTIMFGLGGIYVEVLKDVTFRISPISKPEAEQMVKEIKTYPLLAGVRGQKPKDIDAVADVIQKVSVLVDALRDIAELDINPLVALEKGAVALDARITLKKL